MTSREEASRSRLEAMGAEGQIDKVRAVIDASPPVLKELGITVDQASELLRTPISGLEAAGGQPSQLEAIVKAVGRPPLIVTGGIVQGKHTLNADFPPDTDVKIAGVEPFLPYVGRVEFLNHDMAWGGTAWVIAEEADHLLICTNRHVAEIVARRTFRGDGVYMFAPANLPYGAQVDFIEEVDGDPNPDAVFRIEKFTYLADDASADVAIGRIAKPDDNAAYPLMPLDLAEADGEDGEIVAVVGYPARDSLRNDLSQMENYFKGLYDVKRFAPGFLQAQGGVSILSHDCTTLGGNSGSPVIRLEDAKVVGLHFAGRFAVGNSAVRVSTLRSVLDGTVPTHVPGAELSAPERPDGVHDADHFNGRGGYDPDFLQVVSVPLPQTPANITLSKPSDATAERPHELRYQNFGILYSGQLKSPVLAAMNLDGALTRPQKRGSDKWYSDGRLPATDQLGKDDYDDPAIDRGHLIRRAATNWGETEAEAKLSNADSFHYTIASPQHMSFNRSRSQWLGIEDYIMSNARTHGFRCCVFTGPIIVGGEPPLKNTGSPIPLNYFKVVTMLAEEEGSLGILRLHATAYVLSQGQLIQQLLIGQGDTESTEGFAFGEFKTFQTRIVDLEEMSGFDFGTLKDADPLARRVEEMAVEGPAPTPFVTVEGYANIVL
ncbi:nuclease [Sulfitobacter sp. JBTF-M27]|uniref:Nuclease n=1 Tax=Sulfitobacter sediminilitoris TaxID=2698830 RepID=A0A6P0CGL9_9RHOB|nr:DNA/RNA non-specific endonuclease [Sulfitobacter sediminilitoris]NEK23614.1 nuclease [Sulfitobacter sediminilitoris]